jgi:hypothetical protein
MTKNTNYKATELQEWGGNPVAGLPTRQCLEFGACPRFVAEFQATLDGSLEAVGRSATSCPPSAVSPAFVLRAGPVLAIMAKRAQLVRIRSS